MASAAQGNPNTTQATVSDGTAGSTLREQLKANPTTLEEDDEFEDFPIDDWTAAEQEIPPGSEGQANEAVNHLWEESWDDDDENAGASGYGGNLVQFNAQLKAELERVKAGK